MPSPSGSGRPLSRHELAEAVNAYLWDVHRDGHSIDATYVGHLEAGRHRWPGKLRREAFRHVLGVADDRAIGFHIIKSASRPATPSAVNSSRFPALSHPEWEAALGHLTDEWHVLVRVDNLLGPRHAIPGVEIQLRLIAHLLQSNLGHLRAPAVRLAARYAESMAWLQEDADDLARAQGWTGRAIQWAYEVGDHDMLAWAAYRRSQQLVATRRPQESLGLISSARRDERALPAAVGAAMRVQHARALVATGAGTPALRLLDAAHGCAADDRTGDARRDGHGSFCTVSYIEIQRGTCLGLLGRHRDAVTTIGAALSSLPAVYRRDRASALAHQAAAHTALGELDAAAVTAREALRIAAAAGSLRIVRHVDAVARRLRAHRRLEPVAALLHDLGEVAT